MLDRLLRLPGIDVTGVVVSTRVLRKTQGFLGGALSLVRKTGLRYGIYLGLATTIADMMLRKTNVYAQAKREGIPTLHTSDINQEGGPGFVAGCAPQVLLSGFFNQRLAPELCAVPAFGAVNIHPGKLPRYRGVDPVFFAKLRGARPLHVSVHRVTAEFDCGPILVHGSLAGGSPDTLMADTARLFCMGVELFTEAMSLLQNGRPGMPQIGPAHYDSWPSPDDVSELTDLGIGLFSAADLRRLGHLEQWCEH